MRLHLRHQWLVVSSKITIIRECLKCGKKQWWSIFHTWYNITDEDYQRFLVAIQNANAT